MTTQLDFDTVEALGLDGTGCDLNGEFPYTVDNLSDEHFVLLMLLADEAETYPGEAACPSAAVYKDEVYAAAYVRFGQTALENIGAYAVEYHTSLAELVQMARDNKILPLMDGGVA